jgi:hypothetical protein
MHLPRGLGRFWAGGRGARVGAGVVPPGPAVPHPEVHRLVASEGVEHVRDGLDYGDAPTIVPRLVLRRDGHSGGRGVAERHGVADARTEWPEPVRDPRTRAGVVVPLRIDGQEAWRDDGDHAMTLSGRWRPVRRGAGERMARLGPEPQRSPLGERRSPLGDCRTRMARLDLNRVRHDFQWSQASAPALTDA